MEPSSRTPEGRPNRCPVCGKDVCIEPSIPPGDAPCPHCGCLLWFDPNIPEGRSKRLEMVFQHAMKHGGQGNYNYVAELLLQCVLSDPSNLIYVQSFVGTLQKKYGNAKKGSPLAQFKQLGARKAVKEGISQHKWNEVVVNGVKVLTVNPWDVSTLTALATACQNLASDCDPPTKSRFAECSLFYAKCAADASS